MTWRYLRLEKLGFLNLRLRVLSLENKRNCELVNLSYKLEISEFVWLCLVFTNVRVWVWCYWLFWYIYKRVVHSIRGEKIYFERTNDLGIGIVAMAILVRTSSYEICPHTHEKRGCSISMWAIEFSVRKHIFDRTYFSFALIASQSEPNIGFQCVARKRVTTVATLWAEISAISFVIFLVISPSNSFKTFVAGPMARANLFGDSERSSRWRRTLIHRKMYSIESRRIERFIRGWL